MQDSLRIYFLTKKRNLVLIQKGFMIGYLSENESRTFKEAMSSSKAPLWKEAIKCEMESIMENDT